MFDLSSVPNIVIKEISYNDIDIAQVTKGHNGSPHKYHLYNKGSRWMLLDKYTNKEIKEFYGMYDMAYGDVLLTGFGFGILACWIASKPDVTSVTVVEVSQDIVDVFLLNNTLPEKVNVIIADASNYKTDKHYDCLFLDHYEHHYPQWMFKDMQQIAKNIPNHDVFWFWSLETRALEAVSPVTEQTLVEEYRLYYAFYDFYPMYEAFKVHVVNIPTLPKLDKAKFNEYVYTYFDKLGYSVI